MKLSFEENEIHLVWMGKSDVFVYSWENLSMVELGILDQTQKVEVMDLWMRRIERVWWD